jgi:serine phosphatase RsbU (regulator of sigma subunit)
MVQADSLQRANHQVREAYSELNEKNLLIEKKNRDVTASIQYASRIQQALLPMQQRIHKAIPEHFIFFRPRDIVSGDFYWFAQVNDVAIIAAVDCTGHGVPGAFMSMLGNSALDDIVLRRQITDPSQILEAMHQSICTTLQQEHTANRDGMDAAVCAIS